MIYTALFAAFFYIEPIIHSHPHSPSVVAICVSKDMCYQNRELQDLDPAAISSTCLVSLQQPSGILLLEEGLVHASVLAEPPSKRSRGRREIPPDTNKWIHLARYYGDTAPDPKSNSMPGVLL